MSNQIETSCVSANSFEKLFDQIIAEKRKSFDFYKPYPIFKEFHSLGKVASIRLLLAANRIGKTFSCLAEFSMHATLNYPDDWVGYRYTKTNLVMWVGGISSFEAEDLTKRLFDGVGKDAAFIHPSLVIYKNRTQRRYKIKNALGGFTDISIKTYGTGEKRNEHSTWKAAQVDCILLDEQPTMSVFTECCMRIMNTGKNDHGMIIIAATCTQYTPFVLSFTDRVQEIEVERNGKKVIEHQQTKLASGEVRDGSVYLVAGWDDAQHLDDKQKNELKSKMLPYEVEARTKGMPSIGSGLIYPVLEQAITCDPFPIPKHYARIVGMDFGWTDPTALVFGALDRDTGVLYVTFEYSVSQKVPDAHLADLRTMGAADCLWWSVIMGDPAGQSSSQTDGEKLFQIYKQKGLRLEKADNAIASGLMTCLEMFTDGRLKIFNTNKRLLNELKTYAYDSKGKIPPGNDHLLDAMRYMVSGIKYARNRSEINRFWQGTSAHRAGGIF